MGKKIKKIKSKEFAKFNKRDEKPLQYKHRYKGKLGLMCPECFKIYTIKINTKEKINYSGKDNIIRNKSFSGYCEKCGNFVCFYEIDGNISKAIEFFNKKGFFTDYCCEGHEGKYTCETYISFKSIDYFNYINEYLPDSWYIDGDFLKEERLVIRGKRDKSLKRKIMDIYKMAKEMQGYECEYHTK